MAFLGSVGAVANKSGTSTQAVTASQTIPAGSLLFMIIGVDNTDATNPTTSISTAGGGTWTLRGTVSSGVSASNGSGVFGYLYSVTTTSSISNASTISTVTFSSSPTSRAIEVIAFDNTPELFRGSAVTGSNTGGTPTATDSTPVAGDIVIGAIVGEDNTDPTGDADTTNGSWAAINAIASTGASAATNVAVGLQYKIVSATGSQTYNPTTANDSGVIVITLATPLAANISGQSNSSGQATATATYRPTIDGTATSSGSLPSMSAVNTFVLTAQSNSSGSLAAGVRFPATLSGQSNSAGQFNPIGIIRSTFSGQSTSAGSLAAFRAMGATMSGQATSTGAATVTATRRPSMTGQSNSTGSFAPIVAFRPTATGQSNASGSFRVGIDSKGTMTATAFTYGALAAGRKADTTLNTALSTSSGQASANFTLSTTFIGWGNPI